MISLIVGAESSQRPTLGSSGWAEEYEPPRILSVPSRWVAHYLLQCFHDADEGSSIRSALDEIFMAEWTQNFVLAHVRAASHGLGYLQHPDQRHGSGFLGERRRLFRIPPGVARLLGEINPFLLLGEQRDLGGERLPRVPSRTGIDVGARRRMLRLQLLDWRDSRLDHHRGHPQQPRSAIPRGSAAASRSTTDDYGTSRSGSEALPRVDFRSHRTY